MHSSAPGTVQPGGQGLSVCSIGQTQHTREGDTWVPGCPHAWCCTGGSGSPTCGDMRQVMKWSGEDTITWATAEHGLEDTVGLDRWTVGKGTSG